MSKLLKVSVLMLSIMMLSSGCASYMVYKSSEHKVMTKKAIASGDQAAIKAVQLNNGAGIGIDVTKLEALSEQPFTQIGAALLDAAVLYGSYKGVDSLNNNNDKPATTINISGNENSATVITGNNNSGNGSAEHDSDNITGGQ